MFNSELRRKVKVAKETLEQRLRGLRELLAQEDLDDKLRKEIEGKARRLKLQLETGMSKMAKGGF